MHRARHRRQLTLEAWLPARRREILERINQALHDMEYQDLRRLRVGKGYPLEILAEAGGVDPEVARRLLDEEAREEYGISVRKCKRKSRLGLCLAHTEYGRLNGPYREAWLAYNRIYTAWITLKNCVLDPGNCWLRNHPGELDRLILQTIESAEKAGINPEALDQLFEDLPEKTRRIIGQEENLKQT